MAIATLAISGIPPLAGFFGKFYVFRAAMQASVGSMYFRDAAGRVQTNYVKDSKGTIVAAAGNAASFVANAAMCIITSQLPPGLSA